MKLNPRLVFSFQVKLVDYGNHCKIPFSNLRQWSYQCSHLPFQTIEITIENVKADPEVDQEKATILLAERISQMQIKALIIQNIGDIVVRLYDDNGEDVGDWLVKQKLAKSNRFEIVQSVENTIIIQ